MTNLTSAKRRVSPDAGMAQKAASYRNRNNRILCLCNFLSKGWEVSILGFLVFIVDSNKLPLYAVGILSAVFIICQIGVSFFAGKIAHAIHSRNVILLSSGAGSFSWLMLCLSDGMGLLSLAYAF